MESTRAASMHGKISDLSRPAWGAGCLAASHHAACRRASSVRADKRLFVWKWIPTGNAAEPMISLPPLRLLYRPETVRRRNFRSSGSVRTHLKHVFRFRAPESTSVLWIWDRAESFRLLL